MRHVKVFRRSSRTIKPWLNSHRNVHWMRRLDRRKRWIWELESWVRITERSEVRVWLTMFSMLLFLLSDLIAILWMMFYQSSLSLIHALFNHIESVLQFSVFIDKIAFISDSLFLNQLSQFWLLLTQQIN